MTSAPQLMWSIYRQFIAEPYRVRGQPADRYAAPITPGPGPLNPQTHDRLETEVQAFLMLPLRPRHGCVGTDQSTKDDDA